MIVTLEQWLQAFAVLWYAVGMHGTQYRVDPVQSRLRCQNGT